MTLRTKALGLGVLGFVAVMFAQADNPTPATGKNQAGNTTPQFDAARFIKDHDKNKDGKLSKDELPTAAQKEFEQIDTNKDGSISQEELQKHAAQLAQQRPQLEEVIFYTVDIEEPLTTKELQGAYDMLRKLDKNSDGKIDDSEVKAMRDHRRKERIDHFFTTLDANKDGKISKDEARGLWADNFDKLDTNKDGSLDQQEVENAFRMHSAAGAKPTPNSEKPPQK